MRRVQAQPRPAGDVQLHHVFAVHGLQQVLRGAAAGGPAAVDQHLARAAVAAVDQAAADQELEDGGR
jgi:hypothetical protein